MSNTERPCISGAFSAYSVALLFSRRLPVAFGPKTLAGKGFLAYRVAGAGLSDLVAAGAVSATVRVAVPKVGEVSGQSRPRQRGRGSASDPYLAGQGLPLRDGRVDPVLTTVGGVDQKVVVNTSAPYGASV